MTTHWQVGDVLVWSQPGATVYRKITDVRDGPAYSWRYCEADGQTYGDEFISENSNDVRMWGWEKVPQFVT